jgi:hypothetical protein
VKFARDRHGIANRVISNPFLGPPPAATAPPLPMQEAVLQPPPLQAAMPSVQSVGWHGLPMSRRDYLLGMPHANHPMAQQQMYGAAQHIHPSQHAASSVFYAAAGGGGVAHAMGCCSAAGCGCSGNFPSAATASSVGLAPAHGPGPAQEVSDSSPFPMPAGMCAAPSQRESSPWPVPGMAAAFPLPGAPTHAAMMGCALWASKHDGLREQYVVVWWLWTTRMPLAVQHAASARFDRSRASAGIRGHTSASTSAFGGAQRW